MENKCPGQDRRSLKIENITCPVCGNKTEIFSDEIRLYCPKCKELICRERLPSCVDWCRFGKDCAGNNQKN